MMLIGRLRRGGSVLALLAAVILVVPSTVDCALFGHDADAHPAVFAPVPLASTITDSGAQAAPDHGDGPCAPHLAHCLVKSVLFDRTGGDPVLLLSGLLFAVTLAAAATMMLSLGGVRGPPVAAVPVVGGRGILTRICIDRR